MQFMLFSDAWGTEERRLGLHVNAWLGLSHTTRMEFMHDNSKVAHPKFACWTSVQVNVHSVAYPGGVVRGQLEYME